jgi:hypothetical protein
MTAYTTTAVGQPTNTGGNSASGFPAFTVIEGYFDATKRNLAQNDTIELADIPAKTLVLGCHWEVLTVEGAARNFSVGITGTANKYQATTSANSATSGVTLALTEGTPNTAAGYEASATKLLLAAVTSGGLTTTKIRVKLFCLIT